MRLCCHLVISRSLIKISYLHLVEATHFLDELEQWFNRVQQCGRPASFQDEATLRNEHAALTVIIIMYLILWELECNEYSKIFQ